MIDHENKDFMNRFKLFDILNDIPIGASKILICENVSEAVSTIESVVHQNASPIAIDIWTTIPGVRGLIKNFFDILFRAVKINFIDDTFNKNMNESSIFSKLTETYPTLSKKWIDAFLQSYKHNQLPKGFPNEIMASHLGEMLQSQNLIVIIGIDTTKFKSENLLGIANAINWIAQRTKLRYTLLIPRLLAEQKDLESILYDAETFLLEQSIDRTQKKSITPTTINEKKHYLLPVIGKPHPFSQGEIILSQLINLDNDLSGFFLFNQVVTTVKNTHYMVDLLWPEGNLIIEVDGYRFHSSRYAFQFDRQKDYELIVSNFIVLRMTHQEIIEDPKSSLEKIRDVFNFIKKQQIGE